MDVAPVDLPRRQRVRAQAFTEIVDEALVILDAGGVEAVTLAAIAKSMGMSAPGLYRYFSSRDALMNRLAVLIHEQLAEALETEAEKSAGSPPEHRLRGLAATYREWALAYPMRFATVFGVGTVHARGEGDPPDLVAATAAADRGMAVLIDILADAEESGSGGARVSAMSRTLRRSWRDRTGASFSGDVLYRALVTWTRLHGVVSLEISGAFGLLEVDAGSLVDAELDALISQWNMG